MRGHRRGEVRRSHRRPCCGRRRDILLGARITSRNDALEKSEVQHASCRIPESRRAAPGGAKWPLGAAHRRKRRASTATDRSLLREPCYFDRDRDHPFPWRASNFRAGTRGKLLAEPDRTVGLAGESTYDRISARLEPVVDGYWIGWQSSAGDVRMARLTLDLELDGKSRLSRSRWTPWTSVSDQAAVSSDG